jgi:hypothetical protein
MTAGYSLSVAYKKKGDRNIEREGNEAGRGGNLAYL